MTDIEEIPGDNTPMMYERLPNLQPKPEDEPEDTRAGMKKVLYRNDTDETPRLGGLRD